jgi:DNA-binding transcriptional regulator YiaG
MVRRPKKWGAPLRFSDPTGDPIRDRIATLRRKLKLSQAALGARLGLTGAAVRAWETGKAAPSGKSAELLEQFERQVRADGRGGL